MNIQMNEPHGIGFYDIMLPGPHSQHRFFTFKNVGSAKRITNYFPKVNDN
jgi:hypothetical protein